MKFFIFLLFSFFLLSGDRLNSQPAVEAVLKSIIEAETDAFTKMSMADLAQKYWLLDEYTMLCVTVLSGDILQIKKEDMLQDTSVPPAGHATFSKTNYRFIITGNIATATYDQVVTLTDTGDKIHSRELHIFKLVGETWKIHQSSVHQFTP